MNNKKEVQEWMKEWCNLIEKSNLPKEDYWIETIFGKFKNPDIFLHQNESINEINVTLKYEKWEDIDMNKEKYNQIIDEAYENYSKEYEKDNSIGLTLLVQRLDGKSVYRKPDKQMFIGLCTYDKTFSEKWGLKIEERVLGLDERINLIEDDKDNKIIILFCENPADEWLEGQVNEILTHRNIPTKLITITYKNEKIEVYE